MIEKYMRQALELAQKGMGHTAPNPMVGCVIVKENRVIATGYHERIGGYHAERNALLHCKEDPEGADLYVTLEPCCHYGKTPPCTEIIMEKKIRRVYVGSLDCNPLVAGKGVQILRDSGIEVVTGILEEECRDLNRIFYHFMQNQTPFVAMKYAMTMDGKIACVTGDSKWVTGEAARNEVQKLRKQYTGIMVGIGTVLADDPMLNCRMETGVDPIRIICDSSLRIPMDCKIVKSAREISTIVVCTARAAAAKADGKMERLRSAGVDVMEQLQDGAVNLRQLMVQLGLRQIDSILLEGGGTLNAAALEAGIVQYVYGYIAPKLVGGSDARTPVEGVGVTKMQDAFELEDFRVEQVGRDICIQGRIKNSL